MYCDRAGGILARETDYSGIKLDQTKYKIEGAPGQEYQFTVKFENKDGEITNYTGTIKVIIPNPSLPNVNIWPFRVSEQKISIDWKYPDSLVDLKGFRI